MVTWDIWYIYEGFLVWIIHLTCLSRESISLICTTSLSILVFIVCLTYLPHVYMYLCSSYCLLYACFQFQIHRYTWFTVVPLISLMLFVITCTCILGPHHLIMYTCTYYARQLASLYVLAGLCLTILDFDVQILETGHWWPYCSWSECAADPSVTIRVQQKFGSSPQLFLPFPLLFGSRDPSFCSWASLSFFISLYDVLSFCISLHMMYFCISSDVIFL